jgi:hypothetical protein
MPAEFFLDTNVLVEIVLTEPAPRRRAARDGTPCRDASAFLAETDLK